MAGNSHILEEYFVRLGYRVDGNSQRDFDKKVTNSRLGIGMLMRGIVGVGSAVAAMVHQYARGMEQLYYGTRRAESAAGTLKALSFGFRNAGLSGEQFQAMAEGFARNLRLNPGLVGLIEGLGVPVGNRDRGKVLIDFLDKLKSMPYLMAAQYGSLFGIDPDELLLITEGLEKIKEAAAMRERMAKLAGLDEESAARTAVIYQDMWRGILEKVNILKSSLMIAMLPTATAFVAKMNEGLTAWSQWLNKGTFLENVWKTFKKGVAEDSSSLWQSATGGLGDMLRRWGMPAGKGGSSAAALGSTDDMAAVRGDPDAMLSFLETKYGLPRGMLDKIWKLESNRGQNMGPSRAGALGHFQFMPKTAAEYGITGREHDFEASADAAARKLRNLMRYYGGDEQFAAMAYNVGEGNLDKILAGDKRMPLETAKYGGHFGPPIEIKQETTIQVSTSDPNAAAQQVLSGQNGVNEDMGAAIRNNLPRLR